MLWEKRLSFDTSLNFNYLLQIVEFLRKREDFVDLMIKHIGTSAIMDLLLRMLTCVEPQQLRQDVLNVSVVMWFTLF
jgi:hypothetical protein